MYNNLCLERYSLLPCAVTSPTNLAKNWTQKNCININA